MKKFFILIFFLWSVLFSEAQEIWTLDQSLRYAEENSLMILLALNDIGRAEADLAVARQRRIPSLSFSSSFNMSLGRTIDPTTNEFTTERYSNQSGGLSSGVQLFNGGAIHNQIRDARMAERQAHLDVAATKQDVQLAVVQQFFQALFSRENVYVAESNLQMLREQEKRTSEEVRAGSKPNNELLEIQAEVAAAEQRLIQSQNQYDMGILQFKQLLRLPADEEIELAFPLEDEDQIEETDLLSLPQLRDRALAVAPSLHAARVQVDRAKAGIGLAKSQYYPSLSLGGSFNSNFSSVRQQSFLTGTEITDQTVYFQGDPVSIGFESPVYRFESIPYLDQIRENWGLALGLQLSVPIYSQGQTRANVQRAKINHIMAEIQEEQQTQRLTEDIERNLTDLKASFRSYVAAQKAMEASSRFFENVQLSFEIGASTSFELINAQTRKEEAEVNLLVARYEYLARKKSLAIYLQEPVE